MEESPVKKQNQESEMEESPVKQNQESEMEQSPVLLFRVKRRGTFS